MTPRLPAEVKAKRGRKWTGEISRGPGSSSYDPMWGRLTIHTQPMSRRKMRRLVEEALSDPTTQRIAFRQVEDDGSESAFDRAVEEAR